MKNNTLPSVGRLPALSDPARLSAQAAAAADQIAAAAASANTQRSYRAALRYWAGWHQGRYGQPLRLPLPAAAVVQFIVDHRERDTAAGVRWELPPALDQALVAAGLKAHPGPWRLATLTHRVSVLSKVHQLQQWPNPADSTEVRQLLANARRAAHKRGERPTKKTAITRTELQALLATCGPDLAGVRDRALLSFAFASGGRRRSEVAAATLDHLRALPEGGFVYHLDKGKTLQDGPKTGGSPDKPLLGAAAAALQAWLDAAGLTEGALFRRVWGTRVGPALSDRAIALVIQRRAALAGLKGDFGGHSLRSGFVTEGARQGVALPALMAMTDHRSVASVVGYYQGGSAKDNPASRLME
ncbi:tyrosine-type recombinase/integrase [Stenotrophomonas maltophilia]|jgi:integrase|uniref:tyrosine-type recombinase/integrase n=1 Tax=Stenotrophomonas maltophilia TaxID=40324 RepID=UPI00066C95EC|nr:tyrosine-type recombinase/integrase [Stenotrophomonas maltophilia]